MNLLAIVAALGLEQWRAFQWRPSIERAMVRYARWLERKLNGGMLQQGMIATVAALAPPALIAAALWWVLDRLHPLLGVLWNVVALYLVMGFRRISHTVSVITTALKEGDLPTARRALASWRGGYTAELPSLEVAKLAIERGLDDAYRQVFAVLFWFAVLPGPAGAVFYRTAVLLAAEWREEDAGIDSTAIGRSRTIFGRPARKLLVLLDWLPARLTALSFAIVGDFEDSVYCWRTQARSWAQEEGGLAMGVVLASGGGALGVQLGGALPTLGGQPHYRPDLGMGEPVEPEVLPSGIGLIWRALVLWLLLILLMTLANIAP